MMKASGFWVLLLVLGTALMLNGVSSTRVPSTFPDLLLSHRGEGSKMKTTSRSLKESEEEFLEEFLVPAADALNEMIDGYIPRTNHRHAGNVNLDDYRPIDPSPSSKASIKHGPIEYSAPLNPYIPKSSPPRPSPTPIGSP